MRWRFSLWDPVVALLLIGELMAVYWLRTHLTGMVPTHWGASGQPDHFAPVSTVSLLVPVLIGPVFYAGLRFLDGIFASRRPQYYGFMTNLAGGMALMMALLAAVTMVAMWRPGFSFKPMPLIGPLFIYMGWLMRTAKDVPFNTAGLIPDTWEARNAVRQPLGMGMMITGAATTLLGFLPGSWAMISLAPLIIGPLLSIGLALGRAPSK